MMLEIVEIDTDDNTPGYEGKLLVKTRSKREALGLLNGHPERAVIGKVDGVRRFIPLRELRGRT